MQNLKILILKNDSILITEIDVSDAATYDMRKWPVFTDQKELMIHSDSIFTIVDPKPDQIELYLKTIK
jgi:hypothetical protein